MRVGKKVLKQALDVNFRRPFLGNLKMNESLMVMDALAMFSLLLESSTLKYIVNSEFSQLC